MKNCSLFLLLCIGIATSVQACSCLDLFVPLTEVVCQMESTDAPLLEIRIVSVTDTGVTAQVERLLRGEYNEDHLYIPNDNRYSCNWDVSVLTEGSRYLLIGYGSRDSYNEFEPFSCGFTNNLYQLNEQNTEINYLVSGEPNDDGGFRIEGLGWQEYPYFVADPDCNEPEGVGAIYLNKINIYPNPGSGRIKVSQSDTEQLQKRVAISVYNSLGKLVGSITAGSEPAEIDLTTKKAGIYLIRLSDGKAHRTVRYVHRPDGMF